MTMVEEMLQKEERWARGNVLNAINSVRGCLADLEKAALNEGRVFDRCCNGARYLAEAYTEMGQLASIRLALTLIRHKEEAEGVSVEVHK